MKAHEKEKGEKRRNMRETETESGKGETERGKGEIGGRAVQQKITGK